MLDIRYFSGLFDGEGCICLVKQHLKRSDNPTYAIRLVVSMTHKPIIKAMQAQFGGLYSERRGSGMQRNSFAVMWASRKATAMLEMMLPHLILKREEAEVALDFQRRLSRPGTSFWRTATKEAKEALQAEREFVRAKLSALKRVNHSVKWDADEFGENPMPGESAEGQSRAKPVLVKTGSV